MEDWTFEPMPKYACAMIGRCLLIPPTLLAAFLCGCDAGQAEARPSAAVAGAEEVFANTTTGKPADNNYLLVVHLRLVAVELPVGTVSSSEQIWSYLDEEGIRQARTAVLTLNGIRIGRGQEASWPDVARVLQRMTGRAVNESMMTALPGDPVPIILKAHQPAQTIFVFDQDGTLRGADYPPGDNLLRICCTLDQDDPSQVLITGLPQIRTSRMRTRFIRRNGRLIMADRPDLYSLTELTFQALLPSKDFLVIGPGIQSARPSSVGHKFLVKDKEGIAFEILLVIKVEVVAAPARTKP